MLPSHLLPYYRRKYFRFSGWFVNDDFSTFSFDAFNRVPNGALVEIVAILLHGQPVYSDHAILLLQK